jgi:hypothetical protein
MADGDFVSGLSASVKGGMALVVYKGIVYENRNM